MKQFAVITILCMFSFTLFASTGMQSINAKQHNQKDRIKTGVTSGELTKKETKKLVQEQKNIRRVEAKIKSDGVITIREKAKISTMQKAASRDIYNKKHNNRDRK